MKIVFYSVVLNQHQAPVADELWAQTNHNFTFVELTNLRDTKGGTEDYSERPYLLKAWESAENYQLALELSISADCCIFSGIESLPFEAERMKYNKLSFEMSERWFKKGVLSLLSPRFLKWLYMYYKGNWINKDLYKLCCSAYCARDHYRFFTFKGKCYKWGYFTEVPSKNQHLSFFNPNDKVIKIMWCARFIDWKHPEIPVLLADKLRRFFETSNIARDYESFHIDMYGDGKLKSDIMILSEKLGLSEYITFCGNTTNSEIRRALRSHDIFIFTSDRGEGWGAVANEAMSEGCVLIGSEKIGSIPFLIEDGKNGYVFKDRNVNSLYNNVLKAIKSKRELEILSHNGFKTMNEYWSPQQAAKSLISLIEGLGKDNLNPIKSGPCSRIE